ncbi:MAG: helix-turn-helix transcriptional regulator [Clostridia bacterium]|nr:helix-turn-helix transcriptional regulator [Clostridia bacterium]
MIIKIGAIIKKLRLENSITQETLATALGVTPQAISRWESESGYPDIELLPALADFFSVSTDELLGYKLSEREEELSNIKKEMARLSEVGTAEKQVSFSRNAHARFPNDAEIKADLATSLYILWEETKDDALLTEAETLCRSVIGDCSDESIRYDVITTLIAIYSKTNRAEKAREAANLLTPMKYRRELALSSGIGDGNTQWYIQDEIDKLTDSLGTAIERLALHEDLPNDRSTWERKIEILKTSGALYRMIYGEDLLFHHCRLSQNHWLISTYEISLGREEDALASLEKMCTHTLAYDKAYFEDRGKHYTSLLVDQLVYPEISKDFHELTEHTQSFYMLEHLKHKRYDSIRSTDRFRDIVRKLSETAK